MNTRERFVRNTLIVASYNSGALVEEIAKTHGITSATVHNVLREARQTGTTIIKHPTGRRPDSNRQRDSLIIDAYQTGLTLDAIGRVHGISRERVRQIIKKSGIPTHSRAVAAYQRWADEHGDQINETFEQTRSISRTIAAHPEAPASWIRRILRPRAHEAVLSGRTSNKIWSDTEILDALRAAAIDGTVTTSTYTRWRQSGTTINHRTPPTVTLIVWRFGSWQHAVEQAGLRMGRAGRPSYRRRWTRDDALAAVTSYLAEAREGSIAPTFAGYEIWAGENQGHPSGAYLRILTGQTWSEILREALTSTTAAA